MHNVLLLMSTAIAAVTGADDALKTRSADTQPADTGPTDVERSHVEEITAAQLAVMGREVESPAANKTYYRVVALDDHLCSPQNPKHRSSSAARRQTRERPSVAGRI